jgi:hypothetical protein
MLILRTLVLGLSYSVQGARHGPHADWGPPWCGAALWLTHFLKSFLFGVKTLDPVAFFATLLLLIVVALISVWAPAVRATHVDPMSALRID